MHVEVRVEAADFDLGAEWAKQRTRVGGDAGAMAAFVGVVRDQHKDNQITALHLEHYPGMTEQSIHDIVDRCVERWPVQDIVVVHRVGRLEPEDQIVLVLVAGGHRPEAFAACEFLMDFLKTEAVFWKREEGTDGHRWVASVDTDYERRAAWQGKISEGSD